MDNSQSFELIHPERPCSRCGQLFTPRRRDQQYCSRACKEDAHRHRKTGTAAGTATPPEKVDLHFMAGLLDENPHWQFDLGVSPHSGHTHHPEWVRASLPAQEFIPVLNQILQKFRPACVYVRVPQSSGQARTYQLMMHLTSSHGLQGLGSTPIYPLPLSGPQEPPEATNLRVALREKEVRLEHMEKALAEKEEKLATLTEAHRKLRKAYRRWREHVEVVDAENEQHLERIEKYKAKERKAEDFLNSEKGQIAKAIVIQGLEQVGKNLLGQVLSGTLGASLGQPGATGQSPQLEALFASLKGWDANRLGYLNHFVQQLSTHAALWEALYQLVPPPATRRRAYVQFEPDDPPQA